MGLPIGNRFRLRSFLVGSPSLRKEQDTPVIRVQYGKFRDHYRTA
jgi:hypothetical protein